MIPKLQTRDKQAPCYSLHILFHFYKDHRIQYYPTPQTFSSLWVIIGGHKRQLFLVSTQDALAVTKTQQYYDVWETEGKC